MKKLVVLLSVLMISLLSGTKSAAAGALNAAPNNWAISFTYDIPSQYKGLGVHPYRIGWSCLEDDPLSAYEFDNSYVIDDGAPYLFGTTAYMRISGVYADPIDTTYSFLRVHPEQPAKAAVTFIYLSYEEAEIMPQRCDFGVRIDGGSWHAMSPGQPFQYP